MAVLLRLIMVATFACTACSGALAESAKVKLVAAETVYGDIAKQIAGDRAEISSVMANPDQDPHLFETTPAVARKLAQAQIVIVNGADYDPWVQKLLAAAPRSGRTVVNAAELVGSKPGDNPHLWYRPATAPAVAKAIAGALSHADPAHQSEYAARLGAFMRSLEPLNRKIASIRARYAGTPVTATEPVFGGMAAVLGLMMRNQRFQLAVMNDTEPPARDLAAFEDDLKSHRVKVLFYNKQVTDKLTKRLLDVAHEAHINVVGVTETKPAGVSFQDWMLSALDATAKALAGPSS